MRIVLPSNASMKLFPDNSVAEYTVNLPQPINLSKGKFEIALLEVQFTKTWYNVRDAFIDITWREVTTRVPINDGYYNSNETLINKINFKINCYCKEELSKKIKFTYNDITRKCTALLEVIKPREGRLELSPNLSSILGFDKKSSTVRNDDAICLENSLDTDKFTIHEANSPMKLNIIHNIMIYCDLAEPVIVGDHEAPLLMTIPVKGNHWENQCTTPHKLQYVPISKQEVRTISIYIYTDYGELVPFTSGRSVVTLQLRRAKHHYNI